MTLEEALAHLQGDFWVWLYLSPASEDKDLEALQVLFDHLREKGSDPDDTR